MKILFIPAHARTRSFCKKTSCSILPLTALLLLTIPASLRAQEKPAALAPTASARSAKSLAGTNEIPFQPTKYPNVTVRHVPGPGTSPELLRAALEGRRTPIAAVDGITPKGGKLIRVDGSYLIPEFAPPRATTNTAHETPAAELKPAKQNQAGKTP